MTILNVYVDDIIFTNDNDEELARLKMILSKEFEIKDLGKLRYFLGMEIVRSETGIVVSQYKYIMDLLSETGMLDCWSIASPFDQNHKIGKIEEGIPMDRGRYQRLVGKLQDLTLP